MAYERAHDDDWEQTKERIRTRWPALADADLDSTNGDRDNLLGLLQGRLGYAEANARRDLDELLRGHNVVPRDVADEDTHTGTSGPVPNTQVRSGLTSFPDRASEERASHGSPNPLPSGESGLGPRDQPFGQSGGQRESGADDGPGGRASGGASTGEGSSGYAGARTSEQTWRQQDRRANGQMNSMTSMLPMAGGAIVMALLALAVIFIVRRRRASKRRRLMAAVGNSAAARVITKGAKRWASAPRDLMEEAADRVRAA